MSIEAWEKIHQEKSWGIYPNEHLVRFVARNYFNQGSVIQGRAAIQFLDIGCGAGASSKFLYDEGFSVRAFDGSAEAVRRTKKTMSDAGEELTDPDFEVVCHDAAALPYQSGAFDCAVDICTLQHVEELEKAVAEVLRVLKPGGKLFSLMASPKHDGEPETGLQRISFTQVQGLLRSFNSFNLDQEHFTMGGGTHAVAHWIIEATKHD